MLLSLYILVLYWHFYSFIYLVIKYYYKLTCAVSAFSHTDSELLENLLRVAAGFLCTYDLLLPPGIKEVNVNVAITGNSLKSFHFLIFTWHWLVQSQQWKQLISVWHKFKVNIKDTRTTLLTSFWCLNYQLWTDLTHCSVVYVVDIKQANAHWLQTVQNLFFLLHCDMGLK